MATTFAPTTSGDLFIICNPIVLTFTKPQGVLSHAAGAINPLLNRLKIVDPIVITLSQQGSVSGLSSNQNAPPTITIAIVGTLVIGTVINCDPIVISVTPHGAMTVQGGICNWVAWSVINHLDFTITKTNEAGKTVMEWKGCVNEVLKLGKTVAVYGEGGVALIAPVQNAWGRKTIHHIGLLNKEAVAGNEEEHYFIDKKYRMYKLVPEAMPELLDYSEYLALLTNPRLSLDVSEGILYICDGTRGFVYGTKTKSFGEGPRMVTGIGYQGSTLYVTSPVAITVPKFYITTDIYDLGTRKPKTIQELEIGTDLLTGFEVMIESRLSNKLPFIESRWVLVNPSGRAYLPCFGIEFKFHLRSFIYEYLELDYLTVKGTMHEYEYLEALGNANS